MSFDQCLSYSYFVSKYLLIFPNISVKLSYRYFHPCMEALIPLRYAKSSYANILIEKHKNKAITQKGTQGFSVVRPTMLTSKDEREHYTI